MEINWVAVFAAAMSSFVLGGLWYGALFGNAWLKAAGLTREQAMGANKALVFGGSFVLSLIAAATFVIFLGPDLDAATGALYGLTAGLCWVATSYGISYLFEMRPLQLWLINGGYHTLQFTLIGAILGAF
ncbi:MAG: DUF1761 domain-containing protein [Hyphomonadaceae bacterium]|nr:DUF1761 domain-containing protein [Hyphomonadaceae bacterium]